MWDVCFRRLQPQATVQCKYWACVDNRVTHLQIIETYDLHSLLLVLSYEIVVYY